MLNAEVIAHAAFGTWKDIKKDFDEYALAVAPKYSSMYCDIDGDGHLILSKMSKNDIISVLSDFITKLGLRRKWLCRYDYNDNSKMIEYEPKWDEDISYDFNLHLNYRLEGAFQSYITACSEILEAMEYHDSSLHELTYELSNNSYPMIRMMFCGVFTKYEIKTFLGDFEWIYELIVDELKQDSK